jgi:pyruvate,water dikinase
VTVRALERTKTSFVIAGDVGRAAVRDIGAQLVTAGHLADPDHAFHLFADELLERTPPDLLGVLDERLALRERCERLELPKTWIGQPVPVQRRAPAADPGIVTTVTGLGVSPGLVDGRVRVVHSATAETDIEPGDVLVCPTTDPSWLGLMTVAAAMVIDIGAMTSHGAIVARELGVPCVIGTGNGTSALHDGDRVRVDGSRGVVTVIARTGPVTATGL